MVCDLWYSEDLEEMDHSVTDSINNKGVCRTAPATPGLLKMSYVTCQISPFICHMSPMYISIPLFLPSIGKYAEMCAYTNIMFLVLACHCHLDRSEMAYFDWQISPKKCNLFPYFFIVVLFHPDLEWGTTLQPIIV